MVNPLILATAHTVSRRETVLAGLQRVCFWGSVVLPTTYLPILYGMSGPERLQVLAGLVSMHALFLLISRNYSR